MGACEVKPEKWDAVEVKQTPCTETVWYMTREEKRPQRIRFVKFTRCG